tara:strand:- start:5449 stop:5751 length:303 start_codon:yes stop_codon:yes gene_type:complete
MPNFKKDRSKFQMKGFTPFTQTKTQSPVAPTAIRTKAPDDDTDYEGYGRSQLDELKNDVVELKKSIERHSDKPNIVAKMKASMAKTQTRINQMERNNIKK